MMTHMNQMVSLLLRSVFFQLKTMKHLVLSIWDVLDLHVFLYAVMNLIRHAMVCHCSYDNICWPGYQASLLIDLSHGTNC